MGKDSSISRSDYGKKVGIVLRDVLIILSSFNSMLLFVLPREHRDIGMRLRLIHLQEHLDKDLQES